MSDAAPIACSLSAEELPERASQLARLGADSLLGLTVQGARAELTFSPGAETEAALAQFVAAESACCPFFEFESRRDSASTVLSIAAPEDGAWAVRGLVAGFTAGWGGLV